MTAARASSYFRSTRRPFGPPSTLLRPHRTSKHRTLPRTSLHLTGVRAAAEPSPRAAGRTHRCRFRPIPSHQSGPCEHVVIPRRFSGQERRRARRNPATRAAGLPLDPIARGVFFSRVDLQNRDLFVRNLKLSRAFMTLESSIVHMFR
jgi:hypothetical protein